ncbi:serine/threonine protein kinase [Actinoplanes sp. NEAU-A11]|uniref:non-specific serine/threonine protein kinase n=1 Tax=Actinoplanes aureus TaxID=2792083 RepID=A0A931FVF0_9ACTN|nr:serine/threonine protein kinase [Actinoplanes aureus]
MTQDPTDSGSDAPLAGRCVGNSYYLVRPIGQGATGTVWQGEDRSTGEPVAVKLLHESLLRQPRLVTRFVQERTILLMLRHRHVVRVRDLFSVGETLGLVMDLVDGGSLRDHLHRHGTVAPAEAVRLAAQVASALAEAHELGIIHRDLKPDNILLDGSRQTRLTDFGIARILNLPSMTTPNAVVGTPHYMAPEAFHGTTPSPATDVYALGVLLYELVSGHPPYRSDSIPDLMRLHAEGNPERRPGIPDPLWRIITSCLAGKPRLRPSAAELVTDLTALAGHLGDVPALTPPPCASSPALDSEPVRLPFPRRRAPRNDAPRNRWIRPGVTAALVAGTMLASGIATTAWHLGRSGDEPLTVIVAPTAAPADRPLAPRRPASQAPSTRPAKTHKAARGVALPAPKPHAAVRATATAATRNAARSPLPEGKPYGPWQCAQNFVFDLPTRTPLGPRPCHSVGRDVQFRASLTAPAGGRGRIEVRLQDAHTGRTVSGPTTCDGLAFTRESYTHECGPAGANPRRGRTYAVVMSYRYERDGRAATNSSRGQPFTW